MAGRKQPQILAHLRASAEQKARRAWRALPQDRRAQLRSALHPANVAKVQRAVSAPQLSSTPLVGIIIVAESEEQDVNATLRSLVGQKPGALEVLVVNLTENPHVDEVVQGYGTKDPRIQLLVPAGPGIAEAWQTAIEKSEAPYFLLLSAGDAVQKAAISRLWESVADTESDFSVGKVGVVSGNKANVPAWQTDLHAASMISTDLEETPGILSDQFLCNKLFSRSFWDRELASVPHEDEHWQYAVTRLAYLRASAFDILDVQVVNTKDDDGARAPSREQLCRQTFLAARLGRLEALQQAFLTNASAALYDRWITQELGDELFPYYEVVPRTEEDYWTTLHTVVSQLAAHSEPVWRDIRLHNRLILSSVLGDSRADVVTICSSRSDYGSSFPTELLDGQLRARPPYLSDLIRPAKNDLLICQTVDLRLVTKLNHFEWHSEDQLEIGGYAFIPSVDPVVGGMSIQARLVDEDGNTIAELPLTRHEDVRIDWEANDNWTSYRNAAFRASVDTRKLLEIPDSGAQSFYVLLTVSAFGCEVEGPITKRDLTGATGDLGIGGLVQGQRLAVELRPASTGLTLIRVTPLYVAKTIELSGRLLTVAVDSHSAPVAAKISVECKKLGLKKSAICLGVEQNTGFYSVELPLLGGDAGLRTEYQWDIRMDSGFKTPQPIAYAHDTANLDASFGQSSSLRVRLTGYGFLKVEERKTRILADAVELSADKKSLIITGTADLPVIRAPRFVLASGKLIIAATEVRLDVRTNDGSNKFWATFDMSQTPWSDEVLMPESGAYSVRFVPPGSNDSAGYWVPVSRDLQNALPFRIDAERTEVGVSRSPAAAALTIHLRPPFAADELGRFHQQFLRNTVGEPPLSNSILFMCFGGRRATDTPRRLLEEFQKRGVNWTLYWAVADYSVPLPEGASPVLIGSRQWYRLLRECRLLVNNNNFPFYFRKREGQTYIQTWHGTPLKKLGNDVSRTNFSLSYWNLMAREASFWDALLAQNDYAAEVLAKCFGFDGPVVTEGYPRNDSLVAGDPQALRDRVRQELAIPNGKTAILYAPTWRDDAKTSSKQYELVTYLDFEAAQKQLGEDYVLLLRGHHNIAGQRQTAANKFVIDVTEYPEVNDLYLAADILVNDYSSVMFDFCVTRKPILFLTPDIAQYRDATRGFYFDLEELAPGPLLNTTDEVVRAIKRISTVSRRYSKKYESFVQRFAPYCDGMSTARVYDALPLERLLRPSS